MPAPSAEAAMRTVFTELAGIPDDEWSHFRSVLRERRFEPRQVLIREGNPGPMIHFIVSGLVRLYYSDDGRDLVSGFDCENRFVTAYESVLTGEPATFSVEAIEPTQTIYFSGDDLKRLYQRHPCWDRFGRRILEMQWIKQADKMRRFRVLDAEEHSRLLIQRNSPIINRVPLNQLASFLRVTPETLSRIRASVAIAACATLPQPPSGAGSRANAPWSQYATARAAGFSDAGLDKAFRFADSVRSGSVMIVRHGVVVAAWGDVARPLELHSVRKSLVSALFGIAAGCGEISLDRTLGELGVSDLVPLTPLERAARVRDLLAARSGVGREGRLPEASLHRRSRPAGRKSRGKESCPLEHRSACVQACSRQ